MRMYFKHADTRWSNLADYAETPTWEPEANGTWISGEPEGPMWVEMTLKDKFNMAIDVLPEEIQTQILPVLADGQLYIETQRYDRLRALINSVQLPPELEPLRAQLLDMVEDA